MAYSGTQRNLRAFVKRTAQLAAMCSDHIFTKRKKYIYIKSTEQVWMSFTVFWNLYVFQLSCFSRIQAIAFSVRGKKFQQYQNHYLCISHEWFQRKNIYENPNPEIGLLQLSYLKLSNLTMFTKYNELVFVFFSCTAFSPVSTQLVG